MKTQAALDHFGGHAALAAALDVTIPAIYQWGEYPPDKRQLQLERLAPELKAEPGCQERVLGLPEPFNPDKALSPTNNPGQRASDKARA